MLSPSKTRCEPYVGFAWLGWRNKTGRRRRYFYINTFSACIFARICAPICAHRSICICPLVFQGVLVSIYKVSCRQYVAYHRVSFLTGPTQKSLSMELVPPNSEQMTKFTRDGNIPTKHRKNCECCPVSLLIVR